MIWPMSTTDLPEAPELTRRYVRYGASPRAGQALVLAAKIHALLSGRFNVSHDDLRYVAPPALRHRLILNFEAESNHVSVESYRIEAPRSVGKCRIGDGASLSCWSVIGPSLAPKKTV